MKLPKNFLYFLILTQGILVLGHWALYAALVFFFPFFAMHAGTLLIILLLFSFSFLAFSILDFSSENILFRVGYIFAGIWIPTWFYLLLAALASVIVSAIVPEYEKIAAQILFSFALLLSLYGIINARVTRVITLPIRLPGLPDAWKGKTAVLVTDMHLGHVLRYGFAGKVIEKINKLNPEIVFISGDFFDGVKTNFTDLAHLFKSLNSNRGTYFVTGNHEEFAGYRVCEEAIANAGIYVLENKTVDLDGLQIAGLAYGVETDESVRKTLGSMNIDKSKPSVLLKHVPNHMEAAAEAGVSLMLSGHSHQGQVWPGRWITKKVWKGFDYGLKHFKNLQVYTSSGVGTWGPPMRVFTKSEIVKIIFE
jgi:predicted MPP superfamily phosphohydrolase